MISKSGAWAASMVCGAVGLSLAEADTAPRPNIMIVLVDDMGFSDLGVFGSAIETPTLDRLASEGVILTQFYNYARCMPTRASLLTGLYPHRAGLGYMAEPLDRLGYQGHIDHRSMTIAEALREAGYWTMHSGKWHVSHLTRDPAHAPGRRGFDRSFTRIYRVDYFNPGWLALDYTGDPSERVSKSELGYDDDFHLTDATADQAVSFLKEWQETQSDRPFFLYLAFDAPHWPMHAWPDDIAKYRWREDKFKLGWDDVRERREAALLERGLIDPAWTLPGRDPALPAWEDIPGDPDVLEPWSHAVMDERTKSDWDLTMSVYAAMLDQMDRKLGEVVEFLEQTGQLDNTLIMFLSDNGASPEAVGRNDTTEIGAPESYQGCFMPWANVQNTPFRMYKHWVHEGGIATPFMAYWPAGMHPDVRGAIRHDPAHLIDLMSICLDVAGTELPEVFEREGVANRILMPQGVSLVPLLSENEALPERPLFFEHEGNRAVRYGRWKIVSRHLYDTRWFERFGFPWPPREDEWELFDMVNDRTETRSLAHEHPEIVEELSALYDEWALQNGVGSWLDLEPVFDLQVAERRPILRFHQRFDQFPPDAMGITPDAMGEGAVGSHAVYFDVSGGQLLRQDAVTHGPTISIAMWVRFSSVPAPNEDRYLISQMNWPSEGFHLHYRDGQWIFNVLSPDSIGAVRYAQAVQPGVWYHVGAVYAAREREARLFINGQQVASSSSAPPQISGRSLQVGGNGAQKGAGAWLDDIRVYDFELRDDMVRALYHRGNERSMELDAQRAVPWFQHGDTAGAVRHSVYLPTSAPGGSSVTWTSSRPDIISADGLLVRPESGTTIVLTAHLRNDIMERTVPHEITIAPTPKIPELTDDIPHM